MPEETKTENLTREEVVRTMNEQGVLNPHPNDIDVRETTGALDQLADQAIKDREAAAAASASETPETPEAEPVTPEVTPEADPAKAEADAKAKAESAEREEALKKSDEYFKDIPALPKGVSPKSAEAFSSLKIRAAQEITSLRSELEKFQKESEELKAKIAGNKPLTPDLEREIDELRTFRSRIDVEVDPKFKEFNKQIASAQEFIYAQLRKSPAMTEELITTIKGHGGPEKVNLSKVFEKIGDPTLQRLVESKIADIEQASWAREEAIKSAKANVKQYLSEREKEADKAATIHQEHTRKQLDEILQTVPGIAWLKEDAVVDPKADDATKKNVEAFNAFRKEVRAQIEQAAKDDSPQMRAIQLSGMAQLLYLQRVHENTVKQLSTIKDENKKVVDALTKENTELKEKLNKYKTGSLARLNEGGAPANGQLPAKKVGFDDRRADVALDDLAREMMEKRAAQGR